MLVLDTDHVVELDRSPSGPVLENKLANSGEAIATSIITAKEQLRGWLAQIRRQHDPHQQIVACERLGQRIDFFAVWTLLPWDRTAADVFVSLRAQRIRIGTMDLKIAAIALAYGATCSRVTCEIFSRSRDCRWKTGCSHHTRYREG